MGLTRYSGLIRILAMVIPRNYRRLLGRVFTTCHSPVCGSRWVVNGLVLRGLPQGLAIALTVAGCIYGKKCHNFYR